jgi:ATP-dependent Clp protease ATP-binding subunit ClpX
MFILMKEESFSIGGVVKNLFFPIFLKRKDGKNNYVDELVYPYVMSLNSGIHPTAEIIINNRIKTANIGIELNGIKYYFDKNMKPMIGEMNSELGVYLPLTRSKYYIELFDKNLDPVNCLPVPVLGLDGTADKEPFYFFLKDGLVTGFVIKNGSVTTTHFINTDDAVSQFRIDATRCFSSSILHDQIIISQNNLEGKILRENSSHSPQIQVQKEKIVYLEPDIIDWRKPKSVIGYFDKYLIGQTEAKKKVAISLKKYRTRLETNDESIQKGNLLLIGPTGTGKTMLMELVAKMQNLPFVNIKTTAKSQTGYVGENLCSAVFGQLIGKIRLDPGKEYYEPSGIIFIDEFDKLASDKGGCDNMFTKLQQEIVGWAEKDNVRKGGITINTKNLLFVGAGAFSNVEERNQSLVEIVRSRICSNSRMGFNSSQKKSRDYTDEELLSLVKEEDLEKYGLMPELIGRFSERAIFNPLKIDELASIFCNVKNSIYHSYKKIINHDGYTLNMGKEIPLLIAEKCSKKTGARAVKTLASALFNDIIFEPEKYSAIKIKI